MVTISVLPFEEGAMAPCKGTSQAAGFDLYSIEPVSIEPGKRVLVRTGLNVSIPQGYEIQVRPRSGIAWKNGVTVLNTPGTIDSDYCGIGKDFELKVMLINLGTLPAAFAAGSRIAQAIISPIIEAEFSLCETEEEFLSKSGNTDRVGGFGSTNV